MPKPRLAITRVPSRSLAQCELTHLQRQPIDLERARSEHLAYEDALRSLGCEVLQLPEEPDLPDAVFVEDTAVVLRELAVLTRPGAPARRGEVRSVAEALRPHRELHQIQAPATLDGGDVVQAGKRLFVGATSRSNAEGAAQLERAVAPHGYTVQQVPAKGCLHLKSAVTYLGEETLLLNPAFVEAGAFGGYRIIEVDPREPMAANALPVGATLLFPGHFPHTAALLRQAGFDLFEVPAGELAKAEGALTCCSLILQQP